MTTTTTTYNAPTFGSRYDRDLDVKEIAKRVRAEIKLAKKAGALPVGKVSVRIERFSMGQAIRCEVRSLAPACGSLYFAPAKAEELRENHLPVARKDIWTPVRHRIEDTLTAIVNAYNYDNSDSMTDYFDVNYYTTIEISDEILDAERADCERKAEELLAHERDVENVNGQWAEAFWLMTWKRESAETATRYAARLAETAAEIEDADERARVAAKIAEELARAEELLDESDALRVVWACLVEANKVEAVGDARGAVLDPHTVGSCYKVAAEYASKAGAEQLAESCSRFADYFGNASAPKGDDDPEPEPTGTDPEPTSSDEEPSPWDCLPAPRNAQDPGAVKTRNAIAALPDFSRGVLEYLVGEGWYNLRCEPNFSDVDAEQIAGALRVKVQAVNAALGKLTDAGLVCTDDEHGVELGAIVYPSDPVSGFLAEEPESGALSAFLDLADEIDRGKLSADDVEPGSVVISSAEILVHAEPDERPEVDPMIEARDRAITVQGRATDAATAAASSLCSKNCRKVVTAAREAAAAWGEVLRLADPSRVSYAMAETGKAGAESMADHWTERADFFEAEERERDERNAREVEELLRETCSHARKAHAAEERVRSLARVETREAVAGQAAAWREVAAARDAERDAFLRLDATSYHGDAVGSAEACGAMADKARGYAVAIERGLDDLPAEEPEQPAPEQLVADVERALRALLTDAARRKLDGDASAILDAEETARALLGGALSAAREVVEAEHARRTEAGEGIEYRAPVLSLVE